MTASFKECTSELWGSICRYLHLLKCLSAYLAKMMTVELYWRRVTLSNNFALHNCLHLPCEELPRLFCARRLL